jgi:hypothetical protein
MTTEWYGINTTIAGKIQLSYVNDSYGNTDPDYQIYQI